MILGHRARVCACPSIELRDRRLVAVMFTDMVGYTALIQADERLAVDKRDRVLARARGPPRGVRRDDRPAPRRREHEHVPELAGRRAGGHRDPAGAGDADVPVRIGIHVGEVIVEPERLTGDAVNIASRIESFAVAGGVMVSDAAYDQIRNRTRRRRRRAGAVQAQERRPPVRALRGVGRRRRRPGPRASRARASGSRACRATCPSPRRRCIGRAADLEALVGCSAITASSR